VPTLVGQEFSILQGIEAWARHDPSIWAFGVFGSRSASSSHALDDGDLDLLAVTAPGRKERVRDSLGALLAGHRGVALVWGDDPAEFYGCRRTGTLTVEIELHESGTDFFLRHPLLGSSILSSARPLDERAGAWQELVRSPPVKMDLPTRVDVILHDRKGLMDLLAGLFEHPTADPGRIVSHALRNVVWGLDGWRPRCAAEAADALARLERRPNRALLPDGLAPRYRTLVRRLQDPGVEGSRALVGGVLEELIAALWQVRRRAA